MANKPLPSQEVLRQLLTYEPKTGNMFWLPRPRSMFKTDRSFHTWSSRFEGTAALAAISPNGYYFGSIFGVPYLAHRAIWVWVTGFQPDQVDHINGNRLDNRIDNLRSVGGSENHRNTCIPSNNTSGSIGVSWRKDTEKWAAYIMIGDRKINLGCFPDIESAVAARGAAEAKYGFHPNHGRAA